MSTFVICVGRSLGSGGLMVGRRLAERFGIRLLDNEVIKLAAGESGIDEKFFRTADERKGFFSILGDFISPISAGLSGMAGCGSEQLSREHLFQLQSDAIRAEADRESCVIVGRCADYVLREHPHMVSVFIAADKEDRAQRISELRGVSHDEAMRIIRDGDADRASFYNYYNGAHRWGEASTYDLCVNSSVLGIDGTVDFIEQFVRAKLGFLRKNE